MMVTEVRAGGGARNVVTGQGYEGCAGTPMIFSIFDLVADDMDKFILSIHHDKYLRLTYFTVCMLFLI